MQGLFNVLMVGRYAGEKRQDELIDACAKSRHAREIQVILAGKVRWRKNTAVWRRSSPIPSSWSSMSLPPAGDPPHGGSVRPHLRRGDRGYELYGGICLRLVPVIADSPRSATPQFALDERSLFPAGDTDVLAERIDWWLEHPEERREMELRYAEHAKQYTLEHSIQQTEEMFRMAIREQRG